MNWLLDHIKSQSNSIAIICDGKEYTFYNLSNKIEDYIKQLFFIPSNSIVSIISDYSFESIALFLALFERKMVIVPITSKVEQNIKEKISISRCNYKIYINEKLEITEVHTFNSEQHPSILSLKNNNNSGLILFSSGSTGVPKAMVHNLDNLIDSYQGKRNRRLIFLIFLMFDHIGGLNTLLNCLSSGFTMVIPSNRTPEYICELIEKHHVQILPSSPTFLNLILISEIYKKYDLSSLRLITYGTEPMPESLLVKLKESFPKVKFVQTFGTSETGISQVISKSSTSTLLKIDDPNTEYKIVNGELWLKSKTQILGYLNHNMDRFTDDGWFKTGDLIEESSDGYLKIIGRNSDLINIGGEKVLPYEVESILYQCSAIKDCIVFGEYNPIMGQMVVAKILFKDEGIKVSDAKKIVTNFCKDKLDRYKIPSKIIIMSDFEFTERFKKKKM